MIKKNPSERSCSLPNSPNERATKCEQQPLTYLKINSNSNIIVAKYLNIKFSPLERKLMIPLMLLINIGEK